MGAIVPSGFSAVNVLGHLRRAAGYAKACTMRRGRYAGTMSSAALGSTLAASRNALALEGSACRRTSDITHHATPKPAAELSSRMPRALRDVADANTS